ncbi:MAG: ATP-binding protein [Streptosporangiaceae bacterium]
MAELPTGTITLLFSDVEGPTALLGRLGDRYGDVLSAQRAVQHDACSAAGGRELEAEGASFFAVFQSAADAVRCCVAAQRALAGRDWSDGAAVRVRMGLHSGEPVRHEDGYIGLDVHRAARIAATAHGGQVVLSSPTRLLAEAQLPAGTRLDDLGWHRLKDIEAPERIYQLTIVGLQERFPPLKTLGAQTSLPVPMTPLVGREGDLEELRAAVAQPGIRLVTLTGTGGVGKTRLALAVASSLASGFPHGVFFVSLAAVRDPEVMWKTIAGDLNAASEGPAADVVTGYLAERRALLVLDNLEQLDGASEVVAALLEAAPRLVVLATSRRPLHLQGEHEYPVPPLDLPPDAGVAGVAASSAVRLFVQQAELVRPGFTVTAGNGADIAAICRRLDGLPLAIELAASRVRLLAPSALLSRLGDSLDLAAADVGRPSRQQTLRNTIGWSYELLAAGLAGSFRRLGAFAGGCDLEAVASVAVAEDGQAAIADPLEVAAGLLDVSLITVTEGTDGEPRVGMLETVREYALERLVVAGELDETRRRHAEYFADVAERARSQLGGPAYLGALGRLEAENGNLRAALAWSLDMRARGLADGSERIAIGLRLAQALTMFWYQHGHAAEGRRWLERAMELASEAAGAPLARVAHGLGMLLRQQGEFDAALRVLERSLSIARDVGDRDRQARVLNSLGITHHHLGHLDTARSLFENSIAISRELGNAVLVSMRLVNLGNVEIDAGNLDHASRVLQEALTLHHQQGNVVGIANSQLSLATVSLRAGRAAEARDLLSRTFDYVASSSDPEFLAQTLEAFACITAELGECLRAARLAGAAEAIRQKAGMPIPEPSSVLLERFLGPARAIIPRVAWDAELAAGRALTQEQAVALLA